MLAEERGNLPRDFWFLLALLSWLLCVGMRLVKLHSSFPSLSRDTALDSLEIPQDEAVILSVFIRLGQELGSVWENNRAIGLETPVSPAQVGCKHTHSQGLPSAK